MTSKSSTHAALTNIEYAADRIANILEPFKDLKVSNKFRQALTNVMTQADYIEKVAYKARTDK
jgi:hypothetical protein